VLDFRVGHNFNTHRYGWENIEYLKSETEKKMASQVHELPRLTTEQLDDLNRILENEQRSQEDDIANGIITEHSPMIKLQSGESVPQ